MTVKELGLLLHEYDVYDALQFITGAQNAILSALFCKDVLAGLHNEVQAVTDKWDNDLSEKVKENRGKDGWAEVCDWPNYNVTIAGVEISSLFVQDLQIRTFFQNIRNAFDILAQAANAGCLATKARKIERVDFREMRKVFQQQTYKQAFPEMSDWFESIAQSEEFKYIDAYCNRTKHTCSMPTKFTVPILSSDNTATIPAFHKEADQFEKKNALEHIPAIYEFVSKSYYDFMEILKREISKRTYTGDRYYTVKVYQQKYRQKEEEGFSAALIEATTDIDSMPDSIQILFAKAFKYSDGNKEIMAQNCPFDTVYIKAKDATDDCDFIGKFVAEDVIGEDALLRFRTYQKVIPEEGEQPLALQAAGDEKQKGKYYRANRFFAVKTVSDDEEFLKKVNLTL